MGVPLGHRYRVSTSDEIVPVERITKREVDEIIVGGNFECLCKHDGDEDYVEYDGSHGDLSKILHNGKTRVKVAGSNTRGYEEDYRTVVMTAPSIQATILLRTAIRLL